MPPPTLFEYLPKDALVFIDESHVTVPQIGAMYKGDRSRKTTLAEYGFRLPSCLDNRPLKFEEWNHEKEYRYVMLSDSFASDSNQYYTVTIPVYDVYCGLRGDESIPLRDSVGGQVKPIKLSKDLSEYKLN